MACVSGPKIVKSGQVFNIDAASEKTHSVNMRNNILDTSTWRVGPGGVTGFSRNGSEDENELILDADPWGNTNIIWEARPSTLTNADGGWNTSSFTVNNTQTYRMSTWIFRTIDGSGSWYHGTRGYGTTDGVHHMNNSGRIVVAATLVSGGTGYTALDTLTVVGGTGTAATLTVNTVSGGVITGISVATSGSYTVDPTNSVTVTGGTGSGATFDLTVEYSTSTNPYFGSSGGSAIDVEWHLLVGHVHPDGTTNSTANKHADTGIYNITNGTTPTSSLVDFIWRAESTSANARNYLYYSNEKDAAIVSGGTGYTAADVLTVSGGTYTSQTQITVDTVSSGVITAVTVSQLGVYTVIDANPISVTGGTGTGATFDLTNPVRQQFVNPRVDVVDGTEPTLQELLDNVPATISDPIGTVAPVMLGTHNNDDVFVFNGTSDYIDCGAILGEVGESLSAGQTAFSVTYFAKITTFATSTTSSHGVNSAVIAKSAASGNDNFEIGYSGTGVVEYYIDDASINTSGQFTSITVTLDEWHSITLVYNVANDTNDVIVYKNGGETSEGQDKGYTGLAAPGATVPLTIGCARGTNAFFEGEIANVIFFNTALTADEVKQNFQAQRGRFGI